MNWGEAIEKLEQWCEFWRGWRGPGGPIGQGTVEALEAAIVALREKNDMRWPPSLEKQEICVRDHCTCERGNSEERRAAADTLKLVREEIGPLLTRIERAPRSEWSDCAKNLRRKLEMMP